jgi:predicted NAD/FAD-binding protein
MRIGIIGAGVSGMTAAWLLQHDHEVTLIDAAPRLGGHVETIPIVAEGRTVHGELGARFFFDSAYPYFWRCCACSRCRSTGALRRFPSRTSPGRTPWCSAALAAACGVTAAFAPARPPPALAASLDRGAARRAARRDFSITFRHYLASRGYPTSFGPELAYPFLAACWGAPLHQLPDFPVYSLLKGMPSGERAGFYEIPGGMARYVQAFGAELTRVEVRLGVAARRVELGQDFQVEDASGARHHFDRLIVATSARDAAELLRSVPAAAAMRAAVATFRHFETEIVLHGDPAFMPPDPRDWCHNNLFLEGEAAWMSDWQGLGAGAPVFRTWLPKGRAAPRPLYGRRSFHHLVMSPENAVLQRRIAALQGALGLWVTGMYAVDVDNHESALLSALVPARVLAPRAPNLARLLGAVAENAAHGLEVLPAPSVPAASELRGPSSASQEQLPEEG